MNIGTLLSRTPFSGVMPTATSRSFAGRHLLSILMVSTVLIVSGAPAAPITYVVNQTIGAGSVTGDITTDGATGLLTGGDFLAWNLLLQGPGAAYSLTNFNSVVLDYGVGGLYGPPSVDVTATAQALYFDFSGPDQGYLAFQQAPYSGYHYWCNATRSQGYDCLPGASVVPEYFSAGSTQYDSSRLGRQVIAVAAPEPSAWAMMLLGFGGLGAALRSRRRQGAATA